LTTTGLTGTGTSNTITLNTNNFDVTNGETSQATNAAYMVIAPGTHSLTVEYTVKNTVSNETSTIIKTLTPNKAYAANTVYPITAMLFTDYTSALYYQWDAPQNMWYGKTPINVVTGLYNISDAPTASDVDRVSQLTYAGSSYSYTMGGGAPTSTTLYQAQATSASNPTLHEMLWFRDKGDAHWDANAAWTFHGKMYKGGMWLKKPGIIASENGTTVEAMKATMPMPLAAGFEMHGGTVSPITQGTPANTGNYFFLPALGSYEGSEQCSQVIQGYGSNWNVSETDQYTYGNMDASMHVTKRQILALGKSGIYFSSTANMEGPLCLTFSSYGIGIASYGGYNHISSSTQTNIGAINMSSIVNF